MSLRDTSERHLPPRRGGVALRHPASIPSAEFSGLLRATRVGGEGYKPLFVTIHWLWRELEGLVSGVIVLRVAP